MNCKHETPSGLSLAAWVTSVAPLHIDMTRPRTIRACVHCGEVLPQPPDTEEARCMRGVVLP